MKLTLESTPEVVTVDGVSCRVWRGESGGGVPCFALIAGVMVHKNEDNTQFERELREQPERLDLINPDLGGWSPLS